MRPSGATRKFWGMDWTPYNLAAAFSQYFRSLTWVQVRLSLRMAFIQRSLSAERSRDTPSTVKPLSRKRLKLATTLGFSRRQGPHQEAQKSTSTYRPRKEERET